MRRRFPKLIVGLVIFFFGALSFALAQNQPSEKTARIGSVTVTGTRKFPTDQVIAASGLKPGDIVTAKQIQEAADRLAALGIFSAINFHYSTKQDAGGEAVALEFQVHDAPTFPLSFDNFPWFTDSELADAIRSDVGLFTDEAPDSGAMVDEITLVLERLLASKNIKGKVTHQLLAQPVGDGMMMQFRVEGPTIKIRSLHFSDPLATESESFKDRLPDVEGQPYSRLAIEVFENEHVRPLYASKGFLRAQIGPPKVTLTADSSDPSRSGVDVLVSVTPGAAYSFKGVTWQGNTAIASTNLDGALEMKSGDLADGMKIETLWQKIESEYTRHGYLDVKVNPQAQFDDGAHQVSYHVGIAEGPQYHMGEMIITGLSLDAEKRLRRVWLIAPGQVFDNGYYENLVKDLSKPSPDIFGEMPVHYTEFGHLLRPNAEQHTVDVLMDFK